MGCTTKTFRPSLTITLEELITSGYLHKCVFFLSDEEIDVQAVDGGNDNFILPRPVLNAAKISLAISRAFAEKCGSEEFGGISVELEHVCMSLRGSRPIENQENLERLILGHSDGSDGDEYSTGKVTDGFLAKEWVVEGVNVVRPVAWVELPRTSDVLAKMTKTTMTASLQQLGMLVHALFSRDEPLPSLRVARTYAGSSETTTADSTIEGSIDSKRMHAASSLFSDLTDAGDYPISVCRLVSDMIDTGAGGGADSPFESFDEVIDDLEQMVSFPCIYLYDADVESVGLREDLNDDDEEEETINTVPSAKPVFKLSFGQNHYGHKREITELFAISTKIERSWRAPDASPPLVQAEVVLVTGVAGQGKTHLVSNVGDFLSGLDCWIVARTKFERGDEHESRQSIAFLFDKLISNIAAMRRGCEAEALYSLRATKAISDAIDQTSLSALSTFVPSLCELIPEIKTCQLSMSGLAKTQLKPWQLTYLLTKFMDTLLSLDRLLMLSLDDVMWCDSTALGFIVDIIIHLGRHRQQCLIVGTYRPNEVSAEHPLMKHCDSLRASQHVRVTELKLSSLSKGAVVEMVMAEMRLPRRLVVDLAHVVHKKTSGHALFVVQFLSALVRDETISFSLRKLRYDYNSSKLFYVKTWDSVASLIVSNLSLLSKADLHNLRIISCFGMQVHTSTINAITDCPAIELKGISSSLIRLSNEGIIEKSGSFLEFSHDLVHQGVYGTMTVNYRRDLQYSIGIFLGSKFGLDLVAEELPIGQLHLYDNEDQDDLQMASPSLTAVDLINNAGPQHIEDQSERSRFAGWNLQAACEAKAKSNFRSALHYCNKGIGFLGEDPWLSSSAQLCQELHEGAVFASYAIGNADDTTQIATSIIENVTFEQGLFAQLMILRTLKSIGKHQHLIERGLALLRMLNFDLPNNPTPPILLERMNKTDIMASHYTIEQIVNMQKSTRNEKKSMRRNILNIVAALSTACYQTASPHYPLVACALVNYSFLESGICSESASAFMVFGYFQISLQRKYDSGRHWANVAEKILESSPLPNVTAGVMLWGYLLFWFRPIEELADKLFCLYETGMKAGDIDDGMIALCQHWRCLFYGGQKLSMLALSFDDFMRLQVRYNYGIAKYSVLDLSVISDLIGSTNDPYSHFEGSIKDESELFDQAKLGNDAKLIEAIIFKRFLNAFYFCDYKTAALLSKEVSSLPISKMPKIQSIFHCFYYGIVAFYLYRDGKGESYLDEGKRMLEKMKEWHPNSPCTFENKLFLLEAEYVASSWDRDESLRKYELSIKAARDNGFLHEQGLANEFMGHYLASIVELEESTKCYQRAYECYMQWGAVAKARKILDDHNLNLFDGDSQHDLLKRGRDW